MGQRFAGREPEHCSRSRSADSLAFPAPGGDAVIQIPTGWRCSLSHEKADPGHGSRGGPFGMSSPAIRTPASYRLAALAGPSAACPCSLAAMTARLPHRRDDPQPFCLTHAITGRASTSRRCTYTFLRAVLPATRNLPKRGPRRLTCWRGGAAWETAQTSHCHKYGAFKVGAHE
jgi:hypothetical protein